jgi:penicillin-binding protein 1A
MIRAFFSLFSLLFSLVIALVVAALCVAFAVSIYYTKDLPDYSQLSEYSPPMVTRLYAADGRLVEEYAREKRLFVPIHSVPTRLINAFLAAEDKNFYQHSGVDLVSIARAGVQNALNLGRQKSLVGGSTITQQVVKNFLLSSERTFDRKIKEALLAYRISQVFSKDQILELYLNEIYLGNRSYGVAAAALDYFNKSIDELNIAEAALLAALPKAPSAYDPYRNPERAQERRDWVITRMLEEKYITEAEAVRALAMNLNLKTRNESALAPAPFFADSVRAQLVDSLGEKQFVEGGLTVRTTLDPNLQIIAEQAVREGLIAYDRRHGFRGPLKNIADISEWKKTIADFVMPAGGDVFSAAIVLKVQANEVEIGLKNGATGIIPLANLQWARKYLSRRSIGPNVTSAINVLKTGDIIAVRAVTREDKKTIYELAQIPEVNGALVALDPHNGAVLAMVGGFQHEKSQFNRVTQAKRQPGSAFKPFVYLAGMEHGFTPATTLIDAPIELSQGAGLPAWRPQNYSGEYYGPTTLRTALEQSRNIVTVKLAQMVGMQNIMEITRRFGIAENPQRNLSMVLGSAETTLLNITTAYAILVNGGKQVNPYMVERVQDRNGSTILRHDKRECAHCQLSIPSQNEDGDLAKIPEDALTPPPLVDERASIADPIATYQVVSMLRGVVERGTARSAASIPYTIAGKTGTTNDNIDAWFIGFSADLVAGVFIGFDKPQSLGAHETGAVAALPIWKNFMSRALEGTADIPFRRPSGIKLVKTQLQTGLPATADIAPNDVIFEAFKPGTEASPSAAADDYYREHQNSAPEDWLIEGTGGAIPPAPEAIPNEDPTQTGIY